MESQRMQPNHMPTEAIARVMAISASLGCPTASLLVAKVVPIFGELFTGFDVELPMATRFLVSHNTWISTLFVGVAVMLPIVTEFLIPATRRRLIITGTACAASTASIALVVLFLHLPLFELARKVSRLK